MDQVINIFKHHEHWNAVLNICKRLQAKGFKTFLAGGCVRDALLSREIHDFDFATSATPEQILEVFPGSLEIGRAFGTIVVILSGDQFEITTFRKDLNYSDGRHPDKICFSNEREDALRRDFTINAIFFDPLSNELIDFVNGKNDLDQSLIRTVGSAANRFAEDNLRIMRALRFVGQLGFDLEITTARAIKLSKSGLAKVSAERKRIEWEKLVNSPFAIKALNQVASLGVLDEIFVQETGLTHLDYKSKLYLHKVFALAQSKNKIKESGQKHIMCGLAAVLVIFKTESWSQIKTLVDEHYRNLKYSNKEIQQANQIVDLILSLHDDVGRLKYLNLLEGSFGQVVETFLKQTLVFFKSDNELSSFTQLIEVLNEQWDQNRCLPKPVICGKILLEWGVVQGPKVSSILDQLYWAQLQGKFNDLEVAQVYFRKNIKV